MRGDLKKKKKGEEEIHRKKLQVAAGKRSHIKKEKSSSRKVKITWIGKNR